jgi:hypothetical protein
MQLLVQHPEFFTQILTVKTGGLFSSPQLLLNGEQLKAKRGVYLVCNDYGLELPVKIKYNYLDPIRYNYLDPIPKLKIGDKIVMIAPPLKWYKSLFISIPLVLIFLGGFIGGLCGGFGAYWNGCIFRSKRSLFAKIVLSSLVTLGAITAYFIFAVTIQQLFGVPKK